MANSNPIIVGGGISAGSPFTVNHLVYVTNANPPQIASFAPTVVTDSVSNVVYLNVPNSANSSVPTNQNATETIRIKGGLIVSGSGTDSVQIARGATASGTDAISVGRGSSATGTDSIAVGRGSGATITKTTIVGSNSNDNGQQCTVVGWGSGALSAGGIAIGVGTVIQGNGGSASAIAIGDAALAQNSSAGGGNSIAIGTSANARTEDVVLGANASSNVQSILGNFSVVIGNSASANVSGGNVYGVVIGWGGVLTQKQAVVLGGNAQATASAGQTRSIVIGSGAISTATDAIVIGGGSNLSNTAIAIGAGAVDLGANYLQLGAAGTPITVVVIGAGGTIATPAARFVTFTNATGTDNQAGNVTYIAALSTGNATPGSFIIQVGQQVAGSSTTLQTAGAAATFSHTTAGGHLATFGGAIRTSAPTTGTAGNWKLGIRVAATVALDTTQYIQLDVGGTLYKVGIVT